MCENIRQVEYIVAAYPRSGVGKNGGSSELTQNTLPKKRYSGFARSWG